MSVFLCGVAVTAFAAAMVCLIKCLQAVGRYRTHRGRPLLAGIDDNALEGLRLHWPVRESRWPRPDVSPPMSRTRARAYARLAIRARRRTAIASSALVIVGGAWLGTSLKDIWGLLSIDAGFGLLTDSGFMQLIGVLLLVEVALLIGDSAADLDQMATVYRLHADRSESQSTGLQSAPYRSLFRRMHQRLESARARRQPSEAGHA